MVMKIKKAKNKLSSSKTGIAKLGEAMFHIKTIGLFSKKRENAEQEYFENFKMPYKGKQLSVPEQKKYAKEMGVDFETQKAIVFKEIDSTTAEFREYEARKTIFSNILEFAVNIDGEIKGYEAEDGSECDVWDYLGLPKDNYYALTSYFMEEGGMDITLDDLVIFKEEIGRIKSERPTIAETELGIKSVEEEINKKEIAELEKEMNEAVKGLEEVDE